MVEYLSIVGFFLLMVCIIIDLILYEIYLRLFMLKKKRIYLRLDLVLDFRLVGFSLGIE